MPRNGGGAASQWGLLRGGRGSLYKATRVGACPPNIHVHPECQNVTFLGRRTWQMSCLMNLEI